MGLLDSAGEREATGGFREGWPGPFSAFRRLVVPVAVTSALTAPVIAPATLAVISAIVAAIIPAVVPAIVIPVIPAPIAIVIPVEIVVVIDPVEPPAALVEPNPVESATVLIVVPISAPVVVNHDDPCFPPELLEPPMIEIPIPDANPFHPAYVPGAVIVVIVSVPAISDDDAATDRTATDADVRLHALRCRRRGSKQGEQKGGTENKIARAHGVLQDEEGATLLPANASAVPFLIPLRGNRMPRLQGPICPRPGTSLRGARDIAEGLTLYSARRLFS
jgi:hypothetical protein